MADKRAKQLAELIEPLRVAPGSQVSLATDYDPAYKAGWLKKKQGKEHLRMSVELLPNTRTAWLPRKPTEFWSCCRGSMPRATTGRFGTS